MSGELFRDWLKEWEHVDGTECDAGFMAKRESASDEENWFCTEHQKELRAKKTPEPELPELPKITKGDHIMRVTGGTIVVNVTFIPDVKK